MKKILQQIEKASSFNERKEIIKREFPGVRISKGSARMVIPITKSKVLKVAYNEKGEEQNSTEYDVYKFTSLYNKRYLAKVYDCANNSSWIVQKRVKVLRNRTSTFIETHCGLWGELSCLFDLVKNDLTQIGIIDNRKVLFDYGLTEHIWEHYYQ